MTKPLSLTLVLLGLLNAVSGNVWLDTVLKFQREAAIDVPIHEISFPCAHNAYNNPKNLPALLMEYENLSLFKDRVVLENQELTMTQLLNLGVRHLQLDAHYIEKYNETWLCHGSSEASKLCPFIEAGTGSTCEEAVNLEDLGTHTGCSKDAASWDEGIAEIEAWLSANPNEFLWLDIEDQVSVEPNAVEEQFVGPIVDRLGPHIFTVTALGHSRTQSGKPWPTIREMRAINKTVIVTGIGSRFASANDYTLPINPNINYPDNNALNFDAATCNNLAPNWTFFGESDLKVFIDFLGYDINEDGHLTVGDLSPNNLKKVVDCGFAGCTDRIGNDEMLSSVWSWDSPKSQIACQPNLCAILSGGVWTHANCGDANSFACQSNSDPNDWISSMGNPSPASFASNACPSGYTASYPKTPYQNKMLKQAAGNNAVWLNLPLTLDTSNPVCSSSGYDQSPAAPLIPSVVPLFLAGLLLALSSRFF